MLLCFRLCAGFFAACEGLAVQRFGRAMAALCVCFCVARQWAACRAGKGQNCRQAATPQAGQAVPGLPSYMTLPAVCPARANSCKAYVASLFTGSFSVKPSQKVSYNVVFAVTFLQKNAPLRLCCCLRGLRARVGCIGCL